MILTAPDGRYFSLEILGYQFPEIADGSHDSNWLYVRIDVNNGRGQWKSTDPSLLTEEVARLAKWLIAVHAGTEPKKHIGFTEPNLEFRLVESEGRKYFRVCFELESRPRWMKSNYVEWGCDARVEFPLDGIDLMAAAQSLKTQLARYPARARR